MAVKLMLDGVEHDIEIVRRKPHLVLRVDGRLRTVEAVPASGAGAREMTLDGERVTLVHAGAGGLRHVRIAGRTFDVEVIDPREEADRAGGGHDDIHAPMPGAVVSVQKQPGETVARGETVLTIESMKLQTALPAPRDGVVAEVLKRAGETFDKDEVVARLEPLADGD